MNTLFEQTFLYRKNSFLSEIDGNSLMKEKQEAMDSMELIEKEEDFFSKTSSGFHSYISSQSIEEKNEEESDIILLSSRSKTQFTLILQEQITELSNKNSLETRLKKYCALTKYINNN